jgi:superfamily II DNA helicase RecQ
MQKIGVKTHCSSYTMSSPTRPTVAVIASSLPVNHSEPARNSAKSLQKSVRIYKKEELDYEALTARTKAILGQVAFGWQMEIGAAALCGEDIIVDVGTGCGKSLPFSIPLVLHETDVALRVTPLTALMIDQVSRTFAMTNSSHNFIHHRLQVQNFELLLYVARH